MLQARVSGMRCGTVGSQWWNFFLLWPWLLPDDLDIWKWPVSPDLHNKYEHFRSKLSEVRTVQTDV